MHGLTIRNDRATPSTNGQILMLNQVNDAALKALYQSATIAVYPSLYEGFGLPALEALAAGAPLITSNNTSLPEITGPDGEVAMLVNPVEVGQLVHALQTLLENPELSRKFRTAGRKRARSFTWQRTAELTREAYQLCGSN